MTLPVYPGDLPEFILHPKTKVVMLKTAIPPLTNDAEFFPGMPKNWGLSFMINEQTAPTGRSAGSLAWAVLANSYFWIDRNNGVGGVYLTQVLPFADEKALPLFYAFEKSVSVARLTAFAMPNHALRNCRGASLDLRRAGGEGRFLVQKRGQALAHRR